MGAGKKKCEVLKSIRVKLGNKLGIHIKTEECTHGENCTGTCPACDAEAAKLSSELLNQNTAIDNNTMCNFDGTFGGMPGKIRDNPGDTVYSGISGEEEHLDILGGDIAYGEVDPLEGIDMPLDEDDDNNDTMGNQ